jgi:hypothetical protein
MSAITYEKLEDYMEMLKSMDNGKPVFVTIVRATSQQGKVSGMIRVAIVGEYGIFHVFNHNEDIPSPVIIEDNALMGLVDEKAREDAYGRYRASFDAFEEILFKELEKMVQVLKGLGFKKIMYASVG